MDFENKRLYKEKGEKKSDVLWWFIFPIFYTQSKSPKTFCIDSESQIPISTASIQSDQSNQIRGEYISQFNRKMCSCYKEKCMCLVKISEKTAIDDI